MSKPLRATLYNGKVELTRDAEHQYRVNGEKKAGVTGSLKKLIAKPGLMPWALGLAATYVKENVPVGTFITENLLKEVCAGLQKASDLVRDKAGDIGTEVHDWIERWTDSKIGFSDDPELPDSIQIRSIVAGFLEECGDFDYIESERPVYSLLHDKCGTIDAIIEETVIDTRNQTLYTIPDHHPLDCVGLDMRVKRGLLDYKTTSGFYWDQILQALIYAVFYNEEKTYSGSIELVEFIQIVRLDKVTGKAHLGPQIEVGPEASRIVAAFFYLLEKMEELEAVCKQLNPRKTYKKKGKK